MFAMIASSHVSCRTQLAGGVALLLVSLGACAGVTPDPGPRTGRSSLTLQPCMAESLPPDARCTTIEVPEDRSTGQGRKVPLDIVVLPALGAAAAPDPVFVLSGGPGSAAAELAPAYARTLDGLRSKRDIVLVNQRGTGRSSPLHCGPEDSKVLDDFLPAAVVEACRRRAEQSANLRLYTTPIAMDDLDEVRAALGYDQINLLGTSYGTRAALAYLHQHPQTVRTAILQGVAPPWMRAPLSYARDAEDAFSGLVRECALDASCRAAFPDPRSDLHRALERLQAGPVRVSVPGGPQGQNIRVELTRDLVAEGVRNWMYSPAGVASLPLALNAAAQGDFSLLAAPIVRSSRSRATLISKGMFLSVICAEDQPSLSDSAEIARAVAGTFLGTYRLRQHAAGCKQWPRGSIPESYYEPVQSNAPVLILSGEFDPVTPPHWGESVVRHLPGGLHLVVPGGGHGFTGLKGEDCVTAIMARFVSAGTVQGLDSSCLQKVRRPPFVTQQ